MQYKRLCCFKHTGINFQHVYEDTSIISRCLNKDDSCENLKCLYAGGRCDPFFDVHRAVHSAFLVHWTGRDIDDKYDSNWDQKNDPELNQDIIEPYIDRLKNILEYGLWMTSSESDQKTFFNNKPINRAPFYRTCFSELRLSETRVHAKRFGRLGIGVKRHFVLARRGSPMVYFHKNFRNWFFETFLVNDTSEIDIPTDTWWANYLKSMNEGETNSGYVQFKNFDESEWRIIYSEQIENKFGRVKGIDKVVEKADDKFREYLEKYKIPDTKKPKYFLPLDDWLAFIIYPSLAVKAVAESIDIYRIIREKGIKCNLPDDKKNWPKKSAKYEKYSMPFGIDLDSCRNF